MRSDLRKGNNSFNMSGMRRISDQSGEMSVLLIPLVFMTLFFLSSAGFGAWAYMSRQDYKDNSDQKVAVAVADARKSEGIIKDLAFVEAEKNPLTTYKGPDAFGGVQVSYPKTWSAYINSSSATSGSQPFDAYFSPRAVPSFQATDSVFSLRIAVLPQAYSEVLKQLDGQVTNSTITVNPFTFPRVPGVVGVRVDGQVVQDKKTDGSMIIMPMRDKTLQVWTESPEFRSDFNTIILPNLTFSP